MPEDTWYLTIDKNPNGKGLLAVMTQGHPQFGDTNCKVLTLEIVKNEKEAKEWFQRMKVEQPWVTRS